MAKFKNIKKTGETPIMPAAPEFKVVRPLAGPIKEAKKLEPTVKKSVPSVKRPESRPVEVRNKEVVVKKEALKPRKVGTFTAILFVTIALQVVLLVSLLYLSPKLIH